MSRRKWLTEKQADDVSRHLKSMEASGKKVADILRGRSVMIDGRSCTVQSVNSEYLLDDSYDEYDGPIWVICDGPDGGAFDRNVRLSELTLKKVK